jgi:hypothetical protein
MSNQFLPMQRIANAAVANLTNKIVVAQNVHRDFEAEFRGAPTGGKVLIRKPAVFQAKTFDRATGVEVQDIVEDTIEVSLNPILDVTFAVTDEDMTLSIDQFEQRLLVPAMEALVQGIDQLVADEIANISATVTGDPADPKTLAEAGALLTKANVPLSDRKAIVDADLYAAYITRPPFDKADSSGSTDALREANLGRAYGFDTFQSNATLGGSVAPVGGVAFHRSALALVTRTLALPQGATGAVASHDGFGVRVTYGWDQKFKQTTVSLDCMVGTKTISPERAVVLPRLV